MEIVANIILDLYANAHVNMEMHNVGFRFVVWWGEKHLGAWWLADEGGIYFVAAMQVSTEGFVCTL